VGWVIQVLADPEPVEETDLPEETDEPVVDTPEPADDTDDGGGDVLPPDVYAGCECATGRAGGGLWVLGLLGWVRRRR
jgi:hypothetical protein